MKPPQTYLRTPFDELIDDSLAGVGNSSTANRYRCMLTQFSYWLTTIRTPNCSSLADPDLLEKSDFESYMVWMAFQGLSSSSICIAHAAIRTWFDHLGRLGHVRRNLIRDVQRPKTPKRLPVVPSQDTIDRISDSICEANSSWPARDKLIFELLFDTGMKSSKLCLLDIDDVQWKRNAILVEGYNCPLPLSDSTMELLRSYLKERAARLAQSRVEMSTVQALFIATRNRNFTGQKPPKRLEVIDANRIIKKIDPSLSPNILRYACAVSLYRRGANIRTVAAHMGCGFKCAARMERMAAPSLRDSVMSTHPRAHLKQLQ